ncbi:MAG: OB-fold domain-containing protein [Novosphingobium sp.]
MERDPSLLPLPENNPVHQPFWEGAANGKLLFQRCRSCRHAFLPGRQECPECLKSDLEWEEASGRGTLYSWVVYHRAYGAAYQARIPYTVGIVALEEGPRLASNIVGIADPEALVIDQPLELTIEIDDGIAIPRFRPAGPA